MRNEINRRLEELEDAKPCQDGPDKIVLTSPGSDVEVIIWERDKDEPVQKR